MHVNVAIIGLDRLGTSFGLALKRYQSQSKAQHSFTIIGSDPTAFPMKTAQKMARSTTSTAPCSKWTGRT